MGNFIATHNKECLICWDEIKKNEKCTKCGVCVNIYFHNTCEETYRNRRGYCKCPFCQQIGTLYSD